VGTQRARPPWKGKGPARAAADCRRRSGLVGLDADAVRLERIGDAHQRAGGAHAVAEARYPALRLLPDLPAEPVAVAGDDVRVVELVRGVVPGLGRQLG